MELDALRWVTVHPALVHLPIGLLPLAATAYVVAATTRSERWSFVGDVALVATALAIVAAAAFGLLAWFEVDWPGGLEPWPVTHLALGVTSAVLVTAAAIARAVTRRRAPRAGAGWAFATSVLTALVFFTGWVGGEVLVYHGGVAVVAAASGALAPPLRRADDPPDGVVESMHHIRAAYAAANTTVASAVAREPRQSDFTTVAHAAREIQQMARWLQRSREASTSDSDDGHAHSHAHHRHDHARMQRMAAQLESVASSLEQAALDRELARVARAMGALQAECVTCHQALRWDTAGAPSVAAR